MSIITMATLFHDVGWDIEIPHQEMSFRFARDFFAKHGAGGSFRDRVCNAVLLHNQRHIPRSELRIEERILMDADGLDETGILSIVWDSLATATEERDFGYATVYNRIQHFRERRGTRSRPWKTDTGEALFKRRTEILENALTDFKYELGM